MLLIETDLRTSLSNGVYSYQYSGSTREQSPEAYGKTFYSNNVFHGASVQNMQIREFIEEVPIDDIFPVLSSQTLH